jgi:DNA-binding LacI/PurR family transcriptional regulator
MAAVRPTLQTVADAVGVSRSTVSNAYGRPDQLSPELRAKILAAAVRVGYPGPDPTARSLRRGRVGAIGVLFTEALSRAFADPFAVAFLRGLAETAERRDTGLLLLPVAEGEAADLADGATDAVRNAAVDGFCVYCVPDWHWSIGAIQARGLPVVIPERRTDGGPDMLSVGIDDRLAARTVATHVAKLGHRRIAVLSDHVVPERVTRPVPVTRPEDVPYATGRERFLGFRDGMASVGVGWDGFTVLNAAANIHDEGVRAAAQVLDGDTPPTAILACSDVLALGVLAAMAERGLRMGADVSVTGFDGIPEAIAAGLTTVAQSAVEKGRVSGQLLLDPPERRADRQVILPAELVVGRSTGTPEKRRV